MSNRVKKACQGIFLAILLLFSLTGCWDDKSLDSRDLILSMGFYPGNKPHMLTVYFSVPTPTGLASSSGGSGAAGGSSSAAFSVLTGTGYTVAQAFSDAQAKTQRDLYLGHVLFIVFSTKLGPTLFSQVSSTLDRIGSLDKTPFVAAATEPYSKVVGLKMTQAHFPGEYYDQLFSCTTCQQFMLGVRFWEMSDRLLTPGVDLVLPLLTSYQSGVTVNHVALYRHNSFIKALGPKELTSYGMAAGLSRKSNLYLPHFWHADLDFVADKASLRTRIHNGHVTAIVTMKFTATLESLSSLTESAHQLSDISRRSSAIIVASVQHFLGETQSLDVDPLGVGRTLSWYTPNAFMAYRHWHQVYPHITFVVHAIVKINKMGDIR